MATSIYESFDNGTGLFSRVWGPGIDTSVAGQLTIHSTSDNVDSGAMVPPTGADSGFGYGQYSFTLSYEKDLDTGGYALLWPATDQWPGPELDVVELDNNGNPYSALHWANANGGNEFYAHSLEGFDPTQAHTYTMDWQENYIDVYVDGVLQYHETDPAQMSKDAEHGGQNSAPGVGMQTWWSADLQDGENSITIYDFAYVDQPANSNGAVAVGGNGPVVTIGDGSHYGETPEQANDYVPPTNTPAPVITAPVTVPEVVVTAPVDHVTDADGVTTVVDHGDGLEVGIIQPMFESFGIADAVLETFHADFNATDYSHLDLSVHGCDAAFV